MMIGGDSGAAAIAAGGAGLLGVVLCEEVAAAGQELASAMAHTAPVNRTIAPIAAPPRLDRAPDAH